MTPGRAGAAFESVWTRSQDGLRLHARLYRSAGDRGRLPVVCLPGLTRNSSEFHGIATALLDADAVDRIVALDYRGRGLSDHDPDPANYSIPVETTDLLGLLRELDIEAAVFIGVSRGGLISMGLAAARPGLVRGLVLNDIGPVIDRAGLLRIKGYVGQLGAPVDVAGATGAMRARFGDQFPRLSEDEWRAWADTVWTARDGRLSLCYDPALSRALGDIDATTPIPDLWDAFDRLRHVPVMVVRGALSDLLSAETVARMAERHPGLVAIEVADEGHTPFMHRPALAERITRFVAEIAAAA